MPSKRSDRGRLQQTIGELGTVHAYRQRIEDMRHRLIGWWVTPAPAAAGCECRLCRAARAGQDLHLGSITRTAMHEAGALALEHEQAQQAA